MLLPFFEWCETTRISVVVRESLWLFPVIEAVHLLVGRVLRDRGMPLIHIRGDGRIQSDLDQHKQLNLFGSREFGWKSWPSVDGPVYTKLPLSNCSTSVA